MEDGDSRPLLEQILLELHQLRLSTQRGTTDPSPTPSTLGSQAVDALEQFNGFHVVSSDTFPGEPTTPFLSNERMSELQTASFKNESELVQWFEPCFREIMAEASDEVGFKMILLNTERHPWVECPQGGASSKPDGVGLAVEFASFHITSGDEAYQNVGDSNFGSLAAWVLRDSIEFVTKWKVGSSFAQGLGEGIEYHRRIKSNYKKDRHVQESKRTTDVLVANESGFNLVRCYDGEARSLYASTWNSPCSKVALFKFVVGSLWPRPRKRIWKTAVDHLCQLLNVELVESVAGQNCFLGYGSSGRVFLVRRQDADADEGFLVLKVAAAENLTEAKSEILTMKYYQDRLARAGVTSQLVSSAIRISEGYAGLLLTPFGRVLRPLKTDLSSGLTSLRALHLAGFAHRDSRRQNAIMTRDGQCKWIDLRTLDDLEGEGDEAKNDIFSRDVCTMVESFGVVTNFEVLRPHAAAYLRGGEDHLHALLEEIAGIWRT